MTHMARPTHLVGLTMLLGVVLCVGPGQSATAEEVNLYSARKEELIKPLLDKFTAKTGIKVNLVTGSADALLKRLETEGKNTPADMFVTTDAGRLHRAKAAGVLQAISSPVLEKNIPAEFRDAKGYWFGLSLRARPIMYAKGRLDPAELSTYEALADAKWKGRICVRSSENIYNQSLVASMIVANGEEATEKWAEGLVHNLARPPRGGDEDQIKAAAAGQCDITIANTYYLGGMLHSRDPSERAAAEKIAIFWPNQKDRGVHVNVSGAGVTRWAPHRDTAVKLLEYLITDEAQEWYAQVNNEYPAKPGIPESPALIKAWGRFKADTISLSQLGEYNAAAVKLMDRAGWK